MNICVSTQREAMLAAEVLDQRQTIELLAQQVHRLAMGSSNRARYRKQHRELVAAHKRTVREFRRVKKRYDAALGVLKPEQRLALRLAEGRRV